MEPCITCGKLSTSGDNLCDDCYSRLNEEHGDDFDRFLPIDDDEPGADELPPLSRRIQSRMHRRRHTTRLRYIWCRHLAHFFYPKAVYRRTWSRPAF